MPLGFLSAIISSSFDSIIAILSYSVITQHSIKAGRRLGSAYLRIDILVSSSSAEPQTKADQNSHAA
jgi:hypothetical protein